MKTADTQTTKKPLSGRFGSRLADVKSDALCCVAHLCAQVVTALA
jgi:hypothetical protein